MKMNALNYVAMLVITLALAATLMGCGQKSDTEPPRTVGVAEKAGIAADTAASNTVEAAKRTAEAARDVSGKAVDKTGEILEKAGAAIEQTGVDMQK